MFYKVHFENGHQMRQFATMYSKNYCSGVAFYGDKLEYDNILQV